MQWCVERGTIKEGAIVLDPFLGAGTTLAACKVTRRIGLGFEINPAYEPLINKLIYEASPAVLSLTRMASDFE
jgi:DNA modification methylase